MKAYLTNVFYGLFIILMFFLNSFILYFSIKTLGFILGITIYTILIVLIISGFITYIEKEEKRG